MDLLCIGGTRFAGRAFTEAALAVGHSVTVFHRGRVADPAHDLPGAEHVVGDRATDLHLLAGRRWDGVVDFCGYFPAKVRAAAEALADSGWYGFVSSVSAHTDPLPRGANEDSPLHGPPSPEIEEITETSYGPLKVACERAVTEVFGGRRAIVRPGFIVGDRDPTDRFPSLVRRAAAGGEMLAPGPAEAPLQFVDARDLAAFLLALAERRADAVYDVVHPRGSVRWVDVVEAARREAGADTVVRWVDGPWLAERLGDTAADAFPLWDPDADGGYHDIDSARALAAGLRVTPLPDTVRATLAWDRIRVPAATRHGLSAERERELLDAWSER